MKARECWTALLNKATRRVQDEQTRLTQLQQTHQSLQDSRARVEQLYADYRAPTVQTGAAMQGMHDAINQRQFLNQLDQLRQHVDGELRQSAQALQQQRTTVVEAERERMKMQALVDQDLRSQRLAAQAREQKAMDELGLRQFNLRHT
jgi:flagellar export protein FliJ